MEVEGPVTEAFGAASREAGVYTVIGVIERENRFSRGTLYCTLLYFGPEGQLIGRHRKLKPTGSERLIWAKEMAAPQRCTRRKSAGSGA